MVDCLKLYVYVLRLRLIAYLRLLMNDINYSVQREGIVLVQHVFILVMKTYSHIHIGGSVFLCLFVSVCFICVCVSLSLCLCLCFFLSSILVYCVVSLSLGLCLVLSVILWVFVSVFVYESVCSDFRVPSHGSIIIILRC